MSKTFKGRSFTDYLQDPNFDGAFVGGPPLLTPKQTRRLLEHPEKAEKRAREALRTVRERYVKKRSSE